MAAPTEIPSKLSPTDQKIDLYTKGQLSIIAKSNLKTRARDLCGILQKHYAASKEAANQTESMRTNASEEDLINWILKAQCLLIMLCSGQMFTPDDYGGALPLEDTSPQVCVQQLPSIKKTKESILASMTPPGPTMHDTPPRPY